LEYKEHKWENISTSVLTNAASGSSKMSTYSKLRNAHSQASLSLRVGAACPLPRPWMQMSRTITILGGEQVTLQQNSLNAAQAKSLPPAPRLGGSPG